MMVENLENAHQKKENYNVVNLKEIYKLFFYFNTMECCI